VTFLNDEELPLNPMLRQRAQAAGATYVDTYTSTPTTTWGAWPKCGLPSARRTPPLASH
jgi:hypothetical protein